MSVFYYEILNENKAPSYYYSLLLLKRYAYTSNRIWMYDVLSGEIIYKKNRDNVLMKLVDENEFLLVQFKAIYVDVKAYVSE